MASSEAVPFAKTGGLADVAGALPRALAALGHDVRLVIPYYGCVKRAETPVTGPDISVSILLSDKRESAEVFESRLDGGTPVYLVEKADYYGRPELYGTPEGDYPDNAERFCFFSRAVVALIKRLGLETDIIHCHDWQTGLVNPLVRVEEKDTPIFRGTRLVFTVHNLAYQGLFRHEDMRLTGLPWSVFTPDGIEFFGKINLLKAGIAYADAVTTVSRKYSQEIQTEEFGHGLDGLLRKRRGDLYGILNGADYSRWNPESDSLIARNYSREDPAGKAQCKEDLLRCFGVEAASGIPVIGMVGRMADQKGYDLIAAAINDLVKMDLALIILGKGDERYQRLLRRLAKTRRERLGIKIAFDDVLAHKIEAGADYFLMPSRYEPCGLNQIYSMRYGTIPVVRATGGLDDTVSDYDPRTRKGNGFKFDGYSQASLLNKIEEALSIYNRAPHWETIRRNAMACDFSWDRSAREYEKVYLKTMGERRR